MAETTEEKTLNDFRKSFPDGAIQVNKFEGKRKDQVGIKPQYIIERLNDIFGFGGWDTEIISIWRDSIEDDGKIYHSVICELEVQLVNRLSPDADNPFGKKVIVKAVRAHGGGRIINGNIADAYKSAKTDAFGKACSYLEIAHEAYKGDLEDPEKEKMKEVLNKPKKSDKYLELVKAVKIKNINKKKLTEIITEIVDAKADPRNLTDEQYQLVINKINEKEKLI
jgi:hypothetical protein